jgi:formiminoglutamase
MIGFCSDEGVRRNQGRVGASQGPDQLRQQLGKLACHHAGDYLDVGNIICHDGELESAQSQLSQVIDYCHAQGYKTLVLGGGHEIAWGHFNGLTPHHPKLGIINFDAHFDLRPVIPNQQGNSGTPFWQIAEYCQKSKQEFNYCCLGIQELANTSSLFENAKKLHVPYLTCDQLNENDLAWQVAFLENFLLKNDAIYLTVCLDVFNEAFAPGVSAPQALGLFPWQVIPLLKYILQTGKVVSMDIAELSPPFDQGQKTARLAAMLAAKMLTHLSK